MLIQKGGICREIDPKNLQEYKDKGYVSAEDKKPEKPADKKPRK
jgi:hypothetical protein